MCDEIVVLNRIEAEGKGKGKGKVSGTEISLGS
jgi:hypothetical protein